MVSLWAVVLVLVGFGSLLAVAEASISRMNLARAMALHEEGWQNAAVLERIQEDPARYLNSIYLSVMLVQNGSAILVAILAEERFGNIGVAVISAVFTLLYFLVVEAMSKTFAILHSTRAALAVAPIVWALGKALAIPTRVLIWLANVLLPGKGLAQGPFYHAEEIRSMAEVAQQEGGLAENEKDLIHSVLRFRDSVVREVMVPRPDIVSAPVGATLGTIQDLVVRHGFSRIPVFRDDLDRIEGIAYAKDVLKALRRGEHDRLVNEILRPAHFVPEPKPVSELLREMQSDRFHMALVTDEYGSVSGLVTLEDLLEELVGDIVDEYDREEPQMQLVSEGSYRVSGRLSINDLNEMLDLDLPREQWDTVGGLLLGTLGAIPHEGEEVVVDGLRFQAERVQGRRIASVLITRVTEGEAAAETSDTAS